MIYIAGKISGLLKSEAYKKFGKTESELRKLGLKVINPLEIGIGHLPYDEQIERCKEVIAKHATAIFLQRDWKESKGAKLEFAHVGIINQTRRPVIDIYFEESNGMRDITNDVRDGILTCLIPE